MKPLSFVVYAHGRRVKANLIKHETKPHGDSVTCYSCGGHERLQFIAEAVQYGFIEDMHWDVYNCLDCNRNTAHQYTIQLPLAKQVDRIK